MFSQQLNQMRLELSITPKDPLLIRAGRKGVDPTRPDIECVRTTVDGIPSVYIPGSSLKGVMRSHAESLLRSEGLPVPDTFGRSEAQAFRQDTPGATAYAGCSPVGRTFGTLHVKGRVGVSDHIPGGHERPGSLERQRQLEVANKVEQRTGVGIDRLLGSARAGVLFDQEVIVAGRFDGQVLLHNVQLYQLVLVLLVLRDLGEGWVRLGSNTTRGCGRVVVEIRRLVIESHRGRTPKGKLHGFGSLVQGQTAFTGYDLYEGDAIELPAGLEAKDKLLRQRLEVPGEKLDDLGELLVAGPWQRFLDKALEQSRQSGGMPWVA